MCDSLPEVSDRFAMRMDKLLAATHALSTSKTKVATEDLVKLWLAMWNHTDTSPI